MKGDFNPSNKDIFSLRWSFLRQNIYRQAIFDGPGDGNGNQGGQFNTNHSYGLTWTRTLSPMVVNVFRFGYNRTNASFTPATLNGDGAAAFGFKNLPPESIAKGNGGLPQFTVTNYNQLGTRNFRPQFQKPELFSFSIRSPSFAAHTPFERALRHDRKTIPSRI